MFYRPLYRNMLFPFYDRVVKRRNIYNYYRMLSERPWMPMEELHELRRWKLKRLLEYSYRNVPYFRRLFDERGLKVEEVDDIGALRQRGIFTTKEMVRSAGDEIISREFSKEKLTCSTTSGSTGEPLYIYMTYDNWCLKNAGKNRTEDWVGKPVGTRTTIIWGHRTNQPLLERLRYEFYWRFQNYQFLSAFDISEESLINYMKKIKRHGSRFIESYVTPVFQMSKIIEKHGIKPPRLDGILIGAERLFDFQKEQIERSFGCPVFNRYGCTEFSSIASECKEQNGLHINIDNLWVEVVDDGDRPLIGEPGTIVITDLDNYAMPFIRYKIGDRGIMSDKKCRCGRTFPMLDDIVGRVADTLKTPDGREMHEIYFIWRLDRVLGVRRFQIVQKSLTRIQINIEADGSVKREEIERFMIDKLKDLESQGFSISCEFVDRIPLTSAGKMKFFVSEIPDS